MAEQAIKVTLSTKKVVLMRVPKISHQEQALRLVARKAQGDQNILNFLAGVEMLKILIVKVDEKDYTLKEWETNKLDDVFSLNELKQLEKAIQQSVQGDEDDFLPKTEAVSIGN